MKIDRKFRHWFDIYTKVCVCALGGNETVYYFVVGITATETEQHIVSQIWLRGAHKWQIGNDDDDDDVHKQRPMIRICLNTPAPWPVVVYRCFFHPSHPPFGHRTNCGDPTFRNRPAIFFKAPAHTHTIRFRHRKCSVCARACTIMRTCAKGGQSKCANATACLCVTQRTIKALQFWAHRRYNLFFLRRIAEPFASIQSIGQQHYLQYLPHWRLLLLVLLPLLFVFFLFFRSCFTLKINWLAGKCVCTKYSPNQKKKTNFFLYTPATKWRTDGTNTFFFFVLLFFKLFGERKEHPQIACVCARISISFIRPSISIFIDRFSYAKIIKINEPSYKASARASRSKFPPDKFIA